MLALAHIQRITTKKVSMKKILIFLLISSLTPVTAFAKLNVLTTTTTLKSIAKSIGGKYVKVNSITKGTQDPHFVEAKPSYMVKARQADLIIAVGLDLEIGWLPNIIRGSRNPKIMDGGPGYFQASRFITPIQVQKGRVDRSKGDIHALGNPHFILDPLRTIKIAKALSKKFSKLDPNNEIYYNQNAKTFEKKINQKLLKWHKRIKQKGIKKVVTYHKTLSYFLHRFGLKLSGEIETKPGVPPTIKYILSLMETIKKEKVSCILVESFFETNTAQRIKKNVPLQIKVIPTEVNATKKATNYEALIETIVASIESCTTKK